MRIAIIGCGNMGTGLAEQLSSDHQLFLHDRDWNWTQELAQQLKEEACQYSIQAIDKAQLIFLAVKPQNLKEVSQQIESHLKNDQVLVSLLAGTSLSMLRQAFPYPIIVRMMPNLAMSYGKGIIGLVNSPDLSTELKQELQNLLSPLGLIYWLKENQIDALTSLTGSGPAFIFALIEGMVEAGIAMGFQASDAQELIMQMLQGCITLLQKTGQHPALLKWKIASPSGTTIAGLRVFEQEHVRSGLIESFLAAYQRAQELSKHQTEDKSL